MDEHGHGSLFILAAFTARVSDYNGIGQQYSVALAGTLTTMSMRWAASAHSSTAVMSNYSASAIDERFNNSLKISYFQIETKSFRTSMNGGSWVG